MSRGKRHQIMVEIECFDVEGIHSAEARFIRWLELNGHTTSNFSFEIFQVGRIAKKAMRGRVRKPRSDANTSKPAHVRRADESL